MNANIFNLQRFAKVTTKNLTAKADNYTNKKSNVVINALGGNDTVSNTANKVTISGGDGNDIITSIGYTIDEDTNWESDFNLFGTNDSISGGAGNDTIKNVFNNSKTDGGKGDDYIIVGETVRAINPGAEYCDTYYHYVGDKSIVKGGEGKDTLEVYGTNSTVEGGAGNDSIAVYGYNSTIAGGTGDDIISLNGSPLINVYGGYLMSADSLSQKDSSVSEVIKYASGDGKDTVVGFTSNDTLKITSGTFSTVKSGNDIIIKVGKGSVNLKNAVGQTINILSEKGTLTTITTCNDITNATDGKTVEGTKAEDHISNTGKNVTINAAAGNDTVSNSGSNVTINGGTGDDSIKSGRQYILAGMNESDENYGDTAYTYKKTGGNAGTITAGSGNDTIENSQNQTFVDGGKGNDYIVDSYVEISFEEGILENDPETDIEKWTDSDFDKVQGWTERSNENTVKGGAGNDTIAIYGAYSTVEGGKGNDLISLKNTSNNNVVKYASGDGNDTIVGLSGNDTLHITSGTYSTVSSGKNLILKIGKGSVLLKDALADGYTKIHLKDSLGYDVIFNDWTIRNGSVENNKFGDVTLAGSQKADTIENRGENVLITGRNGNDSISNRGDNVSIDGGKGNDYIGNIYQSFDEDGYTVYKGGKNLTIAGGAGNDTIENCGDYVTITGGTGNDSISNGKWNSDGGNNVLIDGEKGNDTISNCGSNVTINGGAGNDYIDNSSGSNVTINGGAGNDSIYNYYSSNVTISGGAGDDLISLDSASKNNLIQYASGDGNDTVVGFTSKDILHITSGDYIAEVSGDDVIFTVGKGTITLKDAVNEKISILTTKTYNSSTSDLFAENNFMTADNLSAIVENNSVGEFEFNSSEKLSQENLITFADK